MRLKLDENLSRHLKSSLEVLGHDVQTAADEGLLTRPDSEVAAAAAAEGRMLLTLDLHFSDARAYPPGTHPGIVLFRPRSMGPLFVNEFVAPFVARARLEDAASCLVVVDPDRVRVLRTTPPDGVGLPPSSS